MSYGSDVCTGGTATTSREYSSYVIANAFDDNPATFWDCYVASYPEWAKYDLGAGVTKVAAQYTITSPVSSGYPTAWTFEGSNDNSNWDVLDTQTAQTFTAGVKVAYNAFSNSTGYRYYQWNISAGSNTDMTVTEFEIMESSAVTTVIGVAASAADVFISGLVLPIFGVVATGVDTAIAGKYAMAILGVAAAGVDTPVSGTWILTIPGAFAPAYDTAMSGTPVGIPITQIITFPNLSGRQISLEFINADSLGGSELYHIRMKMFKSNDRTDHYDDFPNMSGTHLGLEFIQSVDADITLAYASIGLLRRDE